jgi:hypothetical protein
MDGYPLTPPVAGRFSAGVQVSPPKQWPCRKAHPPRAGNLAALITEICQTNFRGEADSEPGGERETAHHFLGYELKFTRVVVTQQHPEAKHSREQVDRRLRQTRHRAPAALLRQLPYCASAHPSFLGSLPQARTPFSKTQMS